MILGSQGNWTTECSTGLGQGYCAEKAQKDHDQAVCIHLQGEGNQVGYHHQ